MAWQLQMARAEVNTRRTALASVITAVARRVTTILETTMSRKTLKLLLAASVLGAVGCQSRITGNEGNLEFSYTTDDDFTDFNKPIAVGAKLDVKVAEAGNRRKVTLKAATTDDTDVLAVAAFSGDRFTLEAKKAGSAEIQVEAEKSGGEVVTDSVNMLARVPEVLKLRHSCTTGAEAAYLVDQDIHLAYDMQMKNGQPVIGYGYHPVTFEPEGAITLEKDNKLQATFRLRTGKEKGEVVVKSTIDDTQARLVLVEKGDVDGATLVSGAQETRVGASNAFHILPRVGELLVCQPKIELTARSETPDICEATATNASGDVNENPENLHGWVTVTGKAVGKCTFSVTYPAAKGGEGVSAQFTTDIFDVVKP